MKKSELVKLREQVDKELKDKIAKLQQEVAQLKMQSVVGKLKDVHALYKKHKDIASIKTILRERELMEVVSQEKRK